ncbi:MAG TPA: NAD(P)/FAD-dependent oxidoreductase [Polyangia bacterium]|nr:NAD(P)/FAD-dependent oxidoreductase [Polyangia bacterium]
MSATPLSRPAPDDGEGPAVVIVGAGFGGLAAARALAGAPVRVTIVDRMNHHLFQPLLYQVAMAALSPAEIAVPIRAVFRDDRNVTVLMAEVVSFDLDHGRLALADGTSLAWDYLVVAAGAETNFYGHPEWSLHAPGLKSIEDAIEIRRRVLVALERAESATDEALQRALLTFVVIGGGPTGLELAGAIAELARPIAESDFRRIDPSWIKVVLVEAGDRLLATFDPRLSEKARDSLVELGVEVRTNERVTNIDGQGVWLGDELIRSQSILWTAGVRASGLAARLGAPLDRGGRVVVGEDCSLPGRPRVFAIGDIARFDTPEGPLPGVSPVAMQQGRYVARMIERDRRGEPREPFRYVDKGSMATIGRSRAVAQLGRLRLSGLLAWLMWLFVHLWYLLDRRNRVSVFLDWCWSYVTFRHGARLITGSEKR